MAQTPVTGIRLSEAMEKRFAAAIEKSGQSRADLHRALLNIGLHVLESESFDVDRALLRGMTGKPSNELLHEKSGPLSALSPPAVSSAREKRA